MQTAQAQPADSGAVPIIARRLGLRFALHYALLAGVLFGIYVFPFELFGARKDWLTGYLSAYAHLAGGVLSVFERGLVVEGTFIHGRFPMQVVRNCDAADVNILFASALLAFPSPLSKKLAPLVLGILALVAANVVRICSLFYVGVYVPGWFKVAHEEVWPLLLVAFAVGLFLVCIKRLGAEPVPSRAA